LSCFTDSFRASTFPPKHREVTIAGANLPGAFEVEHADWIEVRQLRNEADVLAAQMTSVLGAGELTTILLGKELGADAVLLDDDKARKLARAQGLRVRGSIGLLESFYESGFLSDLPAAFHRLSAHNFHVDRRLLNRRLRSLGFAPL
jgi:predicted nucleic acid-binding protein